MLTIVFHDRSLSSPARAFLEHDDHGAPRDRRAHDPALRPGCSSRRQCCRRSYAPNVIDPRPGYLAGRTDRRRAGARWFAVGLAVAAATASLARAWRSRCCGSRSRSRRCPTSCFASGIVLAERTLYLASVGACLARGQSPSASCSLDRTMVAAATASVVLAFARPHVDTNPRVARRPHLYADTARRPPGVLRGPPGGRTRAQGRERARSRPIASSSIARQLFPRDSLIYREAADLAERQQRPALAAALRDSARIARTLPFRSTSLGQPASMTTSDHDAATASASSPATCAADASPSRVGAAGARGRAHCRRSSSRRSRWPLRLSPIPNWPVGVFQDDGIYVVSRQGARQRRRVSLPQSAGCAVRHALSARATRSSWRIALEAVAGVPAERRASSRSRTPDSSGSRRYARSVRSRSQLRLSDVRCGSRRESPGRCPCRRSSSACSCSPSRCSWRCCSSC